MPWGVAIIHPGFLLFIIRISSSRNVHTQPLFQGIAPLHGNNSVDSRCSKIFLQQPFSPYFIFQLYSACMTGKIQNLILPVFPNEWPCYAIFFFIQIDNGSSSTKWFSAGYIASNAGMVYRFPRSPDIQSRQPLEFPHLFCSVFICTSSWHHHPVFFFIPVGSVLSKLLSIR